MRELVMSMSSAMCGMVSKDFRFIFSGGISANRQGCLQTQQLYSTGDVRPMESLGKCLGYGLLSLYSCLLDASLLKWTKQGPVDLWSWTTAKCSPLKAALSITIFFYCAHHGAEDRLLRPCFIAVDLTVKFSQFSTDCHLLLQSSVISLATLVGMRGISTLGLLEHGYPSSQGRATAMMPNIFREFSCNCYVSRG